MEHPSSAKSGGKTFARYGVNSDRTDATYDGASSARTIPCVNRTSVGKNAWAWAENPGARLVLARVTAAAR